MAFRLMQAALSAAVAGSLALASANAAVYPSDGLDGAWFNPAEAGRGVLVDFIPDNDNDGGGVLFLATFTYDADGNPFWVVAQGVIETGVSDFTSPVVALSGGSFGSPFTAPSSEIIGNAQVSLNSCTSMTINFQMDAASGLNDVNLDLVPLSGSAGSFCGDLPAAVQCPATTTAEGAAACRLPNEITGDLYLPAGKNYVVQGKVSVRAGGRLTIAPGVTVIGSTNQSVPNYLSVDAGARIYANGTAAQPITFTGPEQFPGSWAGLTIAGFSNCNQSSEELGCAFEADPDIKYGGNDPEDNSGILRYVRILWAGQQIAPDEELNSLTMLGVGRGTTIEHVQVDGGLDDGFEWFGGTVDGRYLVCSNMGDDCFDTDEGYQGRMQFALGFQGNNPDIIPDSHGIESDNNRSANDSEPRTRPTVANLTLIGNRDSQGGEGIRLRRGTSGNYFGVVVDNYRLHCLRIRDTATFTQGGAPGNQGPGLTMTHSHIGDCAAGRFATEANEPYSAEAWFTGGTGNTVGTAQYASPIGIPVAGSPILQGGAVPSDPWFTPVPYRGAFAGPHDDWTRGWTLYLPR
jgi:hypothetical protein